MCCEKYVKIGGYLLEFKFKYNIAKTEEYNTNVDIVDHITISVFSCHESIAHTKKIRCLLASYLIYTLSSSGKPY
jgi:hypothetical protein